MTKEHKNDKDQLGFQHISGTETAIIRHIASGRTMKYTAVLDLTSAYDQVPRELLMTEAKRRLKRIQWL